MDYDQPSYNCGVCEASGWVWAKKNDAPLAAEYVFVCPCSVGKYRKGKCRAYPEWNRRLEDSYTRWKTQIEMIQARSNLPLLPEASDANENGLGSVSQAEMTLIQQLLPGVPF